MIRFLARLGGMLLLFAGLAVGLVDGTRSIAADSLDWTSFGAVINFLLPQGTQVLQDGLTRNIHPLLWDPMLTFLLPMPAIMVFFILGTLLLVLASDKPHETIADVSGQPNSRI